MGKIFGLMLIFFLITSCLIMTKPVLAISSIENVWTSKDPMHVARGDLGVAVVNGNIYAIGGKSESGETPDTIGVDYKAKGWIQSANEEYDPAKDTWSLMAPIPTPRYDFAIAVYGNKIYCIGGASNFQPTKDVYGTIFTGVNEVYDPETNTWETKAPMPLLRAGLQANVIDGKIYLIGGFPNGNVTEVYDPENDSWTTKSPMPTQTADGYTSVVFDNKIYAMGVNIEIYDPKTDTWTSELAKPATAFSGVAVATIGTIAPERIYILSGSENQIYNPETDTWTIGANVPTNRGEYGVAVLNDMLYAVGGIITQYEFPGMDVPYIDTPIAVNEQYTPVGYGTLLPVVSISSPKNTNYNSSTLSLNFTINEPAFWVGYCLDGKQNITLIGNTTLTKLSNGMHNVTVYANDTFGNMGASNTISFTVAKPESFPTITVAAVTGTIVLVVIVAGLFIYLKKCKH